LKKYFNIFFYLSLVFFSNLAGAQQTPLSIIDDENFSHEVTIGINSNTNSALIGGFAFKYGRKINKKKIWQ
tara:strand:+ start:217 stop:429 length:213 start_codon:yes stop_codon:yes gene_type:complete